MFLVGFPRSGTTLLEQVLSAHPEIFVAGERDAVSPALRHMVSVGKSYPDDVPSLEPQQLEKMREIYFAHHRKFDDWRENRVFVDKVPLNMHCLDLIYGMFPEAKIVTVIRHPCDCVLSCYMNEFRANAAMIQTADLERCARLYDRTMTLYETFKALLPLRFYEVRYEDVVNDLRGEVEKVLNFLGLPWKEDVMQFSRAASEGKFISTPSAVQVNRKIYTSASQRWLKYREQLAPVLPILLPWAVKLGYGKET